MNHRDERLGSAPLGKLMFSLAVPSVAAQLINVLYNIVDRIYIGHIPGYGDVALTGVGVTFPILTMISAFSAFAGMGGAPLASIQLGKKNKQGAEQILGNSAGLLILFSVILTAFFSICKTPILYAFGASDATIVYARDYISIYLIGTIFVQLALGLNAYISGQGEAKTAMLSVLIGAVLNICLDPVFIFVLHLGVRGAAIATIFVAGGQRGMGGTFPDFRKDCDAPVAKEYAPESGCDQDDRRAWNLAVHHAEYGKSCDDHAEYRTSEIRRRPVCWFDVDPDEYHAVDHNSGAGDYTGNPADHQL